MMSIQLVNELSGSLNEVFKWNKRVTLESGPPKVKKIPLP